MSDYISKYTGSDIDSILDGAIELPAYHTPLDIGKVLTVADNGLTWESPSGSDASSSGSSALPSNPNAKGAVLVFDGNNNCAYWVTYNESDDVKVLAVSGSSGPEWTNFSELSQQFRE